MSSSTLITASGFHPEFNTHLGALSANLMEIIRYYCGVCLLVRCFFFVVVGWFVVVLCVCFCFAGCFIALFCLVGWVFTAFCCLFFLMSQLKEAKFSEYSTWISKLIGNMKVSTIGNI